MTTPSSDLPGSAETRRAVEQGWARVCPVQSRIAVESLLETLHAGEAEVIALALEVRADVVLLDDRLARRAAAKRGLGVTGTVGLLLAARRRGLAINLESDLETLAQQGFRLAPAVRAAVLREAEIHSQRRAGGEA